MLFYTSLLLIPGVGALLGPRRRISWLALFPYLLLLILAVGLRDKVGMDWNNYLAIQDKVYALSWDEALVSSEPAFNGVAWLSEHLDFGVYGSNLVTGAIFSIGLVAFARTTANAWMALVAAAPYLVTVVAMSASRQSAALGLLLLAFARWRVSGTTTRAGLILAAAGFHASALLCLAFVVLETRTSKFKKLALLGVLGAALAVVIPASQHFDYYSNLYIDGEGEVVESAGALMHVLLIAGPGALFLLLRNRWERCFGPDPLLFGIAVLSVLAVPAVLFFSTAVDRMSLYLYALPMAFYAGLPYVLGRGGTTRGIQFAIIAVHLAVLVIWLLFANNSFAYLPYSNVLFGS